MADSQKEQKHQGASGFDLAAAAVTGAIVGTGVAIAGAMALKDKKTRDKVKKALTNAKEQAVDYMNEIQKEVKTGKGPIKTKLIAEKNKVKKVVRSVKRTVLAKKDVLVTKTLPKKTAKVTKSKGK